MYITSPSHIFEPDPVQAAPEASVLNVITALASVVLPRAGVDFQAELSKATPVKYTVPLAATGPVIVRPVPFDVPLFAAATKTVQTRPFKLKRMVPVGSTENPVHVGV